MKKFFAIIMVFVMCCMCCGCAALNTSYNIIGYIQDVNGISAPFGISAVKLDINSDSEPGVVDFTVVREDADPVSGKLTFSGEELGVYIPDLFDDYYVVKWATLASVAEEVTGTEIPTDVAAEIDSGKAAEVLMKYAEPIMSFINANNMAFGTAESWKLEGIDQEVGAVTTIEIEPTEDDWNALLTGIMETARDDEDLWELVSPVIESFYQFSKEGAEYASADEFAEGKISEARAAIDGAMESVGDIASLAAGTRVTVAMAEGRVHAVKADVPALGATVGYESAEDEEGSRVDAFVLYGDEAEVLVMNRLAMDGYFADILEISDIIVPGEASLYVYGIPNSEAIFGLDDGAIVVNWGENSWVATMEKNDNGTNVVVEGALPDEAVMVTITTDEQPSEASLPEAEPVELQAADIMAMVSFENAE